VSQALANATGVLPVAKGGTGITSFGTGVATALGQNVTGSGGMALSTSPTLTTPNLGTPSAATLTNATGLPIVAGTTGTLSVVRGGTGDTTYTNGQLLIGNTTGNTLAKATLTAGTGVTITNGTGSITVAAINNGTVTSVGGTGTVNGISLSGTVTSSGNLTLGGALTGVNLTTQVTGTLPVANGGTGITSLGAGVATFLGTPSSANLAAAVTDETGTGALVFGTSPTLTTPNLGTPSAATLTNATGLPIVAGTTGTLSVVRGGTGASNATDARTNLGVTASGADTTYAFRANNLSDLASAITSRTNLGLGSIATQNANNVTITGGSISGITDLAVADGGTGASTLTGYVKGAGTSPLTASATIPNTDITGLGTIATQNANAAAITGGSVNGTTVGASTASTGSFTTLSVSGPSTLAAVNSGALAVTGAISTSTYATFNGATRNFSGAVSSKSATSYTYESERTGTGSEGHFVISNANGVVGSIFTNGSSTLYNTSSDYRLKEDWQPMTGATERVKALKPVNFAWKVGGSRVDGFLAHEAQEVVPECATGEKDAMRTEEYEVTPTVLDDDGNITTEAVMGEREVPNYQGIDQSKLVPLLTAALQEALAKIDSLTARIEALETAP